MGPISVSSIVWAGMVALVFASAARADHTCDPIGDEGWTTVPTHETISQTESIPYQTAPAVTGVCQTAPLTILLMQITII